MMFQLRETEARTDACFASSTRVWPTMSSEKETFKHCLRMLPEELHRSICRSALDETSVLKCHTRIRTIRCVSLFFCSKVIRIKLRLPVKVERTKGRKEGCIFVKDGATENGDGDTVIEPEGEGGKADVNRENGESSGQKEAIVRSKENDGVTLREIGCSREAKVNVSQGGGGRAQRLYRNFEQAGGSR